MPRSPKPPFATSRFAPAHPSGVLRAICKAAVLVCIAGSSLAAPNAAQPNQPAASSSPGRATTPKAFHPDAAARLERYPTDLDFLLAVDDLAAQRASNAGLVAEQFLSMIGTFDRTGDAWLELSTAMGMDSRQAVDALLGQQATVALRTDAQGTQQIALRSTVRRDARDRVTAAFKPSPRGLVRGVPVLSLGKGSIELAVCPSDVRASDGTPCSELILAPRGSSALFEDMLRALREPPPDHALDLAWASLRSMGPSPIALLLRGKHTPDTPQEFFALTARPNERGWSADFVATRSMLDAGSGLLPAELIIEEDIRAPAASPLHLGVTHPEALARSIRNDAILFMSGPVRPSLNADARDRMPITAAMSRFNFPESIWSRLDGVTFVSVHAHARSTAPSTSPPASSRESDAQRDIVMCVAFPVNDIASFAPIADAWGLSFAKGEPDAQTPWQTGASPDDPASQSVPLAAVRALEVHGTPQSTGLVGPRGAIAWTFAIAAGQEKSATPSRGWWIVCAQTGDARAQPVVERAQALALDAASPGDASGEIVFRFMSRPALMRQVTGARTAAPAAAPTTVASIGAALANRVREEASSALDALDRVETVIRRRPTFNELFDGTISIQMRSKP